MSAPSPTTNEASVIASPVKSAPPPLAHAGLPPAIQSTHRRSVADIIAGRANLAEGLAEALAARGPRDPDLISAAGEAMAICGFQPTEATLADPRSGLREGMRDPQRIWALARLQVLCEGYDARAFFAQLDTYERRAADRELALDSPQQLRAAERVLAAGNNTYDLMRAGMILIRNDALPMREVFRGPAPLGKMALIGNLGNAGSLANCARQLGCGPDAATTVLLCARFGCVHGVNYQQAMAATLPPRDYQATVALSNWMRSRRR